MKYKFKSFLTTALMIVSLPISSYAMPNSNNLDNEDKIQIISNKISESTLKLNEKKEKIKENEISLNKKTKLLIENEKQYQFKKNTIDNTSNLTCSTISQSGEFKIIEMILNSNSISEFLQKLELGKIMIKQNNKTLKNLETQELQLTELKNEIEKEQNLLKKDKLKLEKETLELEKVKNKAIEEIKKEEEQLKKLEAMQTKNTKNAKNTKFLNIKISSKTTKKGTMVVEYAKNFIGVPYLWGGSTPSGFDCSGFTSYVFKHSIGVVIPRTAATQQSFGKNISFNDLKAGDLIFFGNPAHHVGMYIGDGQYIHSPKPGDNVKIANVPWNRVSSATRVFN